ncbi:hypothetical protein VTN96DRAFT_4168 [Rasamsonia emersonii]
MMIHLIPCFSCSCLCRRSYLNFFLLTSFLSFFVLSFFLSFFLFSFLFFSFLFFSFLFFFFFFSFFWVSDSCGGLLFPSTTTFFTNLDLPASTDISVDMCDCRSTFCINIHPGDLCIQHTAVDPVLISVLSLDFGSCCWYFILDPSEYPGLHVRISVWVFLFFSFLPRCS